MKENTVSSQLFSILTMAIMISSSYLIIFHKSEELDYNVRVPVWARNQLDYDTEQAYSFVLQQGNYEMMGASDSWEALEHVMISYDLPLGEGGAAVTCSIGLDCPQISLAYWRPNVPSGMKVPVIVEIGPYFGEESAGTPDITTPGSWLGMGILQNLLPHFF